MASKEIVHNLFSFAIPLNVHCRHTHNVQYAHRSLLRERTKKNVELQPLNAPYCVKSTSVILPMNFLEYTLLKPKPKLTHAHIYHVMH